MGKLFTTAVIALVLAVASACGTTASPSSGAGAASASSGSGGSNWIMADAQYGVASGGDLEGTRQGNFCAPDGTCFAR